MASLATEYHHTMLGNGWCNRPPQIDCQFESICESCAYYKTDTSFEPVLEAQRDHADQQDQHHRVDLFEMLIDTNHKAKP